MNVIKDFFKNENIISNKIINYLLSDIANLNGIGTKTYNKLTNLINGSTVFNLLCHFPVSVIDRSYSPLLISAKLKRIVTIKVMVLKYINPYNKSQPYKVICSDGSCNVTINIFVINQKFISSLLKIGSYKIVSGKLDKWNDQLVISNPIITTEDKKYIDIPEYEPVYPLTSGISNKFIRKLINDVLEHINKLKKLYDLPEWIDKNLILRENFTSLLNSILRIHNPQNNYIEYDFKKRIAYDEILASQLLLGLVKNNEKNIRGLKIKGNGKYINKLIQSLPFILTHSQKEVIKEIFLDMSKQNRMIRLIQGDVGSGKTIIALISMINAIECGYKTILMAPTEILAIQHFNKINNLIQKASLQNDIKLEILTGKDNHRQKQEKLKNIKDNNINIIIGTHALFQKSIDIQNIGLIIIDEQHRFGVNQRLMLTQKGVNADILSMTATPIPRTLAMTMWGDMDISIIDELPIGRKPIDTKVISINDIDKLLLFIKNHIANNEKVYWVCPLIEEENNNKLIAVNERFNLLKKYFGNNVAILHGQMSTDEKKQVISKFSNKNGNLKILVSTTVIEVGVDIPDATIIVIENAERFGLSTLHQLRGRVGRSDKKSMCILLHINNISDIAKKRIAIMKNTNDGFEIAEEDLKIRGAGDILGTNQSGQIKFKIADYVYDKKLFSIAKNDVKSILSIDPTLKSDRGEKLKILLKFFEKNYDINRIFSG